MQSDFLQAGGSLTTVPRVELGVPGSWAWPWGIASEHRAGALEMPVRMPQWGEKWKTARLRVLGLRARERETVIEKGRERTSDRMQSKVSGGVKRRKAGGGESSEPQSPNSLDAHRLLGRGSSGSHTGCSHYSVPWLDSILFMGL